MKRERERKKKQFSTSGKITESARVYLISSRLIIDRPSTYQKNRMIARTVFHIRPTDPLIQLARISRRHGQHDIRSVDYYCSKSCGSNELTSPLRNHCRDLTRLAICQNRVWLWDLFPKRSRTISPTVLRLAVCLRLTFTPAHFFFHRVDVSTHRDELRNVRRDVLVAS